MNPSQVWSASLLLILGAFSFLSRPSSAAEGTGLRPVPLKSQVDAVQPMSGIVLWDTSPHRTSDAIQLEFSYLGYASLVAENGAFDWTLVEEKLAAIAGRGHQAIFRFYFVYPGRPAQVPVHIRSLPDYEDIPGLSEGKETGFANWSHPALREFVKDFHTAFAERYDRDPRLAFVQVGFGLWAEYHIYDGPFELGRTFPDRGFQAEFFHHLASTYLETPWSVSVDSAKTNVSPFVEDPSLLDLDFGIFDDSFLGAEHAQINERDWGALGRDRYRKAPAGGEFSYYTDHDQQMALAPEGPHGERFEIAAARFGLTYIIGDDQPNFQSMERIREAGLACGYRFRVVSFESKLGLSRVTLRNDGIAPIYHHAFPAVNGVRSKESLRRLPPGEIAIFDIDAGGADPVLTIESDRLAPGQRIGFDADLELPQEKTSLSPSFFQLSGGIGLFLMGMLLLTDGVKNYAGNSLRRSLTRFTGTPGKAFASGALVTTMVQSSSATTVTVIGFVSAGLISFPQSLGFIFGASLGTTATGWIIATLGLKFSVGVFALPVIGAGAFLRLLGKNRTQSLGSAVAGFGLIFLGIDTLQLSMSGLTNAFTLAGLPSGGFFAHLLAMTIGVAMTVVLQSSSAAVATTLTALHSGAVNFDQAASVVIGAAVGTTVTGVIAAVGSNTPAQRTALAHVFFNLATGFIAVILLPLFLWLIRLAQRNVGLDEGAMSLAAFHTAFIAVGVAIFLPFVHRFARLIERILPDRGPTLTRYLDQSVLRAPSAALEASRRALAITSAESLSSLSGSFDCPITLTKSSPNTPAQLRDALRRIQTFLPEIPPVSTDEPLSGLRLQQMHALDHMDRLQARLEPSPDLRRILKSPDLRAAAEIACSILSLGETYLRASSVGSAERDCLEKIRLQATFLAELRRRERPLILQRNAASGADPTVVLEELDALRWLDGASYHTWRICHYLGAEEGTSPSQDEPAEGKTPEYPL